MHAFCTNAACAYHSTVAFCGYCFLAGCRAERCPLNPRPGTFLNPGPVIKRHAFVITRCRAIAAQLGRYDAAVAEAALARPEVQDELRALLGIQQRTVTVDLQAVRSATWGLSSGELAQYAALMRAHLARAYDDAQRTPRAGAAETAAAQLEAQRALDAALEAQARATREAEGKQRAVRVARAARTAALAERLNAQLAVVAELRGELRDLGTLEAQTAAGPSAAR